MNPAWVSPHFRHKVASTSTRQLWAVPTSRPSPHPISHLPFALTQPLTVSCFLLQPLNTLFMHLFVAVDEYSVGCCKEIIR